MRLRRIPEAKEAVGASELCLKEPLYLKGQWRQKAGNLPVVLEVGMGRGAFIIGNALQNKEKFFIGLECREEMLYLAEKKLQRETAVRGLFSYPENLSLIWSNALLLTDLFAAGEIDEICLNFSDPWPKKKHAKRRLTHENFWKQYNEILSDGGRIYFRTDGDEFFDWSLQSFAESPFKLIEINKNADLPANGVISEYEKRYRNLNQRIYTAVFEKGEKK